MKPPTAYTPVIAQQKKRNITVCMKEANREAPVTMGFTRKEKGKRNIDLHC
jgi:hypothetical protein